MCIRDRFQWLPPRPRPSGRAGQDAAVPASHRSEWTSPCASESDRLSVIASVTGAQALAGVGVNLDALGVSPIFLLRTPPLFGWRANACVSGHFVSHVLEDANRVGREANRLQLDLVRQPLLVEAGSVDRLLNVQSVIHHAHQHIGDRGNDGGAALSTENQEELAVL